MKCPECDKEMLENGVMLMGNVLTGEKPHPVRRWDCPHCEVLVSADINEELGWQQWEKQGNKRPGKEQERP